MNVRTPLAVAVVAVAALSGCSGATTTSSSAPTTGATTAATTSSTSPAPSTQASTAKPASSSAKPASDGCTPSEATLLKALRSSKVGEDLAPTETLTGITCYQGYALGLTHPKQADNAQVVFKYTDGAWQAVNGGTSGYCDDVVPAAVRPHLRNC